jgi:hypothetical protein
MKSELKSAAREHGWLNTVKAHVESLRYGVVQVVVHDSRVVQIDKTERIRVPDCQPAPCEHDGGSGA